MHEERLALRPPSPPTCTLSHPNRWIDPIIATGKRKILALDDLFHLEQDDRSAYVWDRFKPHAAAMERAHRQQQQQRYEGATKLNGGRLFSALFWTWPLMFVQISLYQVVDSLAQFGIPLALRYLVDFINGYQKGEPIPSTAYAMAATLFLAPALAALANVQQFRCARRLIFRWRAALIALVFRQTLRLDPSVASYSSGHVVNLCSVDASNVDALRYFPFLWSIPLETAISIGLIFWVLQCWISGFVVRDVTRLVG